MRQVSAQRPIQDELIQRRDQMERRLTDLRTETEEVSSLSFLMTKVTMLMVMMEVWKTLETAEHRVLQLQQAPVVCISDLFNLGKDKGMLCSSFTLLSRSLSRLSYLLAS